MAPAPPPPSPCIGLATSSAAVRNEHDGHTAAASRTATDAISSSDFAKGSAFPSSKLDSRKRVSENDKRGSLVRPPPGGGAVVILTSSSRSKVEIA
ncbi:hypothetical protein NL676_033531 [Syzygium grande]|nr:hypothetical protein NL676_033531 [Syzygium grande]